MEKLNYEQIYEKLEEFFDKDGNGGVSAFAYENYDPKGLGLGEIEEVAQKGGESMGSEWYSVKYFKDHDVYIKVEGYYSSYDGTHFDGWDEACSEVEPQQKTITIYE